MNVTCALSAVAIQDRNTDLIVLPEGVEWEEIAAAELSHPGIVVVGATIDGNRSRGVLIHNGRNRIEYLKVESDGRTVGSGNQNQCPVYAFADICIGVLICMDVDSVRFARPVIDSVRGSSARLKLVCVPADMGSHWFGDGELIPSPQMFQGVHLLLSNHTKTYGQARCRSFITDTAGRRVVRQHTNEPIHAWLPLSPL